MQELFTDVNAFLNDETTIQVLYALVLIMALLWLLSGGFGIYRGRKNTEETRDKKNKKDKKNRDEEK